MSEFVYLAGPTSEIEALSVAHPRVRRSLDGSEAILKTADAPSDLPVGVSALSHVEALELVAGPAWSSSDD